MLISTLFIIKRCMENGMHTNSDFTHIFYLARKTNTKNMHSKCIFKF